VKQLLKHFGSVAQLRRATAEDVADVPGFGPVLAAAVVDRLHQGEGGDEAATPEVAEVLDAAIPG
jgi:excinuclease ABC subunit C